MPEEQLRQAKLKALRLLERMDRTEAQLREKLLQAEFDPEMVEKAIAYVKSFGYIASAKKSIHDEIWLKTNIDGRAIRIPVIA